MKLHSRKGPEQIEDYCNLLNLFVMNSTSYEQYISCIYFLLLCLFIFILKSIYFQIKEMFHGPSQKRIIQIGWQFTFVRIG